MKYVRLQDGIVVEIITINPVGIFSPEMCAQFVEVEDHVEVAQGMVYEEGIFKYPTTPTLTAEEIKNELRPIRNFLLDQADVTYCNAERWEQMTDEQKLEWRTWKQKMRDWEEVDFTNKIFPCMPI